jgi:hypothetical protein
LQPGANKKSRGRGAGYQNDRSGFVKAAGDGLFAPFAGEAAKKALEIQLLRTWGVETFFSVVTQFEFVPSLAEAEAASANDGKKQKPFSS